MSNTTKAPGEIVSLRSDNGAELTFQGRLFLEKSYYDEENSNLTRLRLFCTDENTIIYSIVSGPAEKKVRRHYSIWVSEDICAMSDGKNTISVPVELLFSTVFDLCGIDPAQKEELRPAFEELLKAANG